MPSTFDLKSLKSGALTSMIVDEEGPVSEVHITWLEQADERGSHQCEGGEWGGKTQSTIMARGGKRLS